MFAITRARINAALGAHPRWATQLTPANVIAAGIVGATFAFMPPHDQQTARLAQWVAIALAVLLVLVTVRDIAVYWQAKALARDLPELKRIQQFSYGFFVWLCEVNASESLREMTAATYDMAEATPQQRADFAWYYTRYELVVLGGKRLGQMLFGVLMLGLLCFYSFGPAAKFTHLRTNLRHKS